MNFGLFKKIPVKNVKTAALGLTAAGTIALNMLIMPWEGNKLKPYLDIGGIPTACGGVTGPKITKAYRDGRVFTEKECTEMNALAVKSHEDDLRSLINDDIESAIPDFTMAAFISWTYNVGAANAGRSTLVRLINAGRLKDACDQLPRWNRVKGTVVRGLQNRRLYGDSTRISEHTLCMIGLDPKYKTPLFQSLYFGYKQWLSETFGGESV